MIILMKHTYLPALILAFCNISFASPAYRTVYYVKDHLGSTRVVVDRKDGSVLETRSYDPLGEIMPDYCSHVLTTSL